MKKGKPFKIAAVVVVGVPVVVLALGMVGFVIKNPFPQNADITLTESGTKLIISSESGNRGRCVQKEPGCVHVSKWRRANIKFRLTNMDDWAFSQIQLVAEASDNAKLNFGPQDGFTDDMAKDFYVKIGSNKLPPDAKGVIDLAGLSNGEAFTLVNRNDFKQTYSYQIQACKGDECKAMDPKIENEGKN